MSRLSCLILLAPAVAAASCGTDEVPWPAAGCTLPALHGDGSAEPVEQNEPMGQTRQSAALVMEMLSARIVPFSYRPAGHGRGALAPSVQKEPGGHERHAVLPEASWYLPATHLLHAPCSASGCTVPGAHMLGSAEPVEQNEPEGHSRQSLA